MAKPYLSFLFASSFRKRKVKVMSDNQQEGTQTSTMIEPARPESVPVSNSVSIPDSTWETAVARWIESHVRNSPIAGSTEAWNHLHSVLPKLKEFLLHPLS